MIRKLVAVGIPLALCLAALSAVAAGAQQATRSAGSGAAAGVTVFSTDPSLVPTSCGAQSVFKKAGFSWSWGGPTTGDVPSELSYLDSISLENPDAIILLPFSPTAFNQKIKSLMSAGVPIDLTDGSLTPFVAYHSFQSDESKSGAQVANGVAKLTGGTGTVGVIALEPGLANDEMKYQPAVALIKKHKGLNVLPIQYGANSESKSASITAAWIEANPDLKVIIATDAASDLGAVSAILAAHDKGKIHVVAYDSSPPIRADIESGEIAFSISQPDYLKGVYAAEDLLAYVKKHGARSGPVTTASPAIIPVPTSVITKSNVNSDTEKAWEDSTSCSFYNGVKVPPMPK